MAPAIPASLLMRRRSRPDALAMSMMSISFAPFRVPHLQYREQALFISRIDEIPVKAGRCAGPARPCAVQAGLRSHVLHEVPAP